MLDATGRAPGRGAYLCRDTACWTAAAGRRSLERALGVSLPDDIAHQLTLGPDSAPAQPPKPSAPARPAPGVVTDATSPDTITGGAHGQE